jgi:hypothetical protein
MLPHTSFGWQRYSGTGGTGAFPSLAEARALRARALVSKVLESRPVWSRNRKAVKPLSFRFPSPLPVTRRNSRVGQENDRIGFSQSDASLHHIKDDDLKLLSVRCSKGTDALDAALCSLGVFSRTPKRGSAVVRRNSIARQLSCLKRPTHHESVVNQSFIAKVNHRE